MRLRAFIMLLASGLAAASSWSFEDASLRVQEVRGAELGAKQDLSLQAPLKDAIILNPSGSVRLSLTVTNGGKARKPHQAFLTLASKSSGLEESFPLTLSDNGRAKFDLTRSKIPSALHDQTVQASIVIGSFGSSKPIKTQAFTLRIAADPNGSAAPPAPVRYGALPEIHHIFKADPSSPPRILSIVFTSAVLTCLPALVITWRALGANVNHLPKALNAAPLSHLLFFGSIVAMELVFYQYYVSWRLFTALPAAGLVGLVAFLSGSRALSEVQERRLKGER